MTARPILSFQDQEQLTLNFMFMTKTLNIGTRRLEVKTQVSRTPRLQDGSQMMLYWWN